MATVAVGAGCGSRASAPRGDGPDGAGTGTDVSDQAAPTDGVDPSASAPDGADDAGPGPDTGALLSPCRFDSPAEMARALLAVAVDGGIVLAM